MTKLSTSPFLTIY